MDINRLKDVDKFYSRQQLTPTKEINRYLLGPTHIQHVSHPQNIGVKGRRCFLKTFRCYNVADT